MISAPTRFVILAAVVAGGAAGGVFAQRWLSPTPEAPLLQTVDRAALAADGIRLRPPSRAPQVTRDRAEDGAGAFVQGSTVRESVLAEVDDTSAVPRIHCTCWVLSITPPEGLPFVPANRRHSIERNYYLLLIDAESGFFVEDTTGPPRERSYETVDDAVGAVLVHVEGRPHVESLRYVETTLGAALNIVAQGQDALQDAPPDTPVWLVVATGAFAFGGGPAPDPALAKAQAPPRRNVWAVVPRGGNEWIAGMDDADYDLSNAGEVVDLPPVAP